MISLDTLLDMDNPRSIEHKPLALPEQDVPRKFLENFHRISARLQNKDFLECLKPYWLELGKALAVISGEVHSLDSGWRLRSDKPRKPTPSEIEERVTLFIRDALGKIPEIPEVDQDQEASETVAQLSEAERELLQFTSGITRLFKHRPRLLTEADRSEIINLRKAAIEYAR